MPGCLTPEFDGGAARARAAHGVRWLGRAAGSNDSFQRRTAYRRAITPLPNRRSSSRSRSSRTRSGKNRFPPPTITGQAIGPSSSTRPARIACPASSGPATVMSWSALAFGRRTASGSNSRSIRVRALRLVRDGVCRLPVHHRFVHPAAVEVGADRRGELVDVRVNRLVRGGAPAEGTVLVFDVAVQRREHRVDQLGHAPHLRVQLQRGRHVRRLAVARAITCPGLRGTARPPPGGRGAPAPCPPSVPSYPGGIARSANPAPR